MTRTDTEKRFDQLRLHIDLFHDTDGLCRKPPCPVPGAKQHRAENQHKGD